MSVTCNDPENSYRRRNRTTANSRADVGSPPARPLLYARWAGGDAAHRRPGPAPLRGSHMRFEGERRVRSGVEGGAASGDAGDGSLRGARGDSCEGRRMGKSHGRRAMETSRGEDI